MNKRLKDCLEYFVLEHEGKVNEDVHGDHGGCTHWGITQADYDRFQRERGRPFSNVFHMTIDEVYIVYDLHYWRPMRCDKLARPLDLVVFDTAVNRGCSRATKYLQMSLDIVADGAWGHRTNDAIGKILNVGAVSLRYLEYRIAGYHRIVRNDPSQSKFLVGWLNRCSDLREHIIN